MIPKPSHLWGPLTVRYGDQRSLDSWRVHSAMYCGESSALSVHQKLSGHVRVWTCNNPEITLTPSGDAGCLAPVSIRNSHQASRGQGRQGFRGPLNQTPGTGSPLSSLSASWGLWAGLVLWWAALWQDFSQPWSLAWTLIWSWRPLFACWLQLS